MLFNEKINSFTKINIHIILKILNAISNPQQSQNWKIVSLIERFVFRNPIQYYSPQCYVLELQYKTTNNNNSGSHICHTPIQRKLTLEKYHPLQHNQTYIIQKYMKRSQSFIKITSTWLGKAFLKSNMMIFTVECFLTFLKMYQNPQIIANNIDRNQVQSLLDISKQNPKKLMQKCQVIKRLIVKQMMWVTVDGVKVLYINSSQCVMSSIGFQFDCWMGWCVQKEQGMRLWRRKNRLNRVPMVVKCMVSGRIKEEIRDGGNDIGEQQQGRMYRYCNYLVGYFCLSQVRQDGMSQVN